MSRLYKSLPVQVLAEKIVGGVKDSYDLGTKTAAFELETGLLVRIHVGRELALGDFFIFEDDHPMGGYHCPRKVFENKYRPVGAA